MAEQRKNKYQTPVYGSLAYDLDTLVRERELEEAGRIERPRPQQAPKQVSRPQEKVQARPRQKVSPLVMGGIAVLVVMVMALLVGYVQLTEVSASVSELKGEINRLEVEHVALVTQYEQTFDMSTVKEMAEAAGMSKPTSGQIEYVDLSGGDSAVVYQADAGDTLERLGQKLADGIRALVEYFK
ncbi:MAG: hypothetical protein E7457_01875 [Ruminococcaceae bacterium]|nr:hypothetical protein [Oscillospiraceae bacterium]